MPVDLLQFIKFINLYLIKNSSNFFKFISTNIGKIKILLLSKSRLCA